MQKKIIIIFSLVLFTALSLSINMATAQSSEQKYRTTIESADKYFNEKDYLNAKASYQVASQLKPEEQYPKDRMKESISLLRIQMAEMAAYNDKLAYADQLYDDKSWGNAIIAYQEASKMMPGDEYPGRQIEEIKKIQQEEAQNEAKYASLMGEGDALFNSAEYLDATKKYDEAANIFPSREEPKDKIKAANDMLAEVAAQQSGYQRALSEAEMYHGRKDYENELKAYETAADLKPEEAFPQIKIRELNEFLRLYQGYNKLVSEADELYVSQQYAEAKVKYEQALEILPDEPYPKEIISKINIALSEKTERDRAAYEEAIAKADALYNQEDYDAAMIAYSDALRFWPDGKHAKEMLSSIDEIRALQKAQEEAYNNLISHADKLFAEQDYQTARSEYRQASDIKPFEQYPKVRMEEIDMIMAELQSKLEQYDQIVEGADKLFNAGDYSEARIQYLKAQEILSERTYPEDQIKMIDEILGLERKIRDEYLEAIARGDEHFTKREWEDAKVDYVTANDLIPEETYPDEKINEINDILALLKAELETYTLAVNNADQLLAQQDYEAALKEYQKAAEIREDEEYPRLQIAEINRLLGDMEAQRILDENYAVTIEEADQLFADNKYEEARAEYEKASSMKDSEQYPKDKITEIDGIIAAEIARLQSIEDAYENAIARADELMTENNYEEARSAYLEAADIKPAEEYPAERIAAIDDILASEHAEAERLARLDADYAALIVEADAALDEQEYTRAKKKYQDALELKDEEQYPQDKIVEIDNIMADMEAQQLLEENYSEAVAEADKLFEREDYSTAKIEYERAASLKEQEQYPKDKIAEIDAIMAEQQALEDAYATAIASADQLMDAGNYSEARTSYEQALNLKPDENYPEEKIAAIDAILDAEAAEAARLAKLEADYSELIASGDAALANEDYSFAKEKYYEALGLKAEEQYPQQKIEEIDGIMAGMEAQRLLEENYAGTIEDADRAFAKEDFEAARVAYENALLFKENEQYPKDKISEIETILAQRQALEDEYSEAIGNGDRLMDENAYAAARASYEEAAELKPGASYPVEKIAAIDAILAAEAAEAERLARLEAEYAALIAEADAAMASNDYDKAKDKYNEALGLKSEEQYPIEKIAEIDQILADIEAQNILDENYAAIIEEADKLFNNQEYAAAKLEYEKAAELKSAEQHPKDRIAAIDAIFAEQQALEDAYASTVANADRLLAENNYEEARTAYTEAAGIKPGETYPQEKIAEIDAIIAEQARQAAIDEQYQIALETADNHFGQQQYVEAREAYNRAQELKADETYPADKIAEIDAILADQAEQKRINDAYANAIAKADNHFVNKEYAEARAEYEGALTFKPAEQHPMDRIAEIDAIYAEQTRLEELESSYNAAIGEADDFLAKDQYEEAKAAYQTALALKPDETYPAAKISEIDNLLVEIAAEQARLAAIEESYNNKITEADAFLNQERYEEAKTSYTEAAQIKSEEDYPIDKIAEIDAIVAEIARLKAIDDSYMQAVNEADANLERRAYLEALQAYERAQEIKPAETYPAQQIAEINSRLSELEEERTKAYNAAIVQADNYYDIGNYRSAKSSYQNAVNIKSDEQYARDRLDEVTKLYMAEVEALKVDYRKYIADGDNYFKDKIYDGAIENYRLASALLPDEEYPGRMISRITKIINDNAITDVNKLAQIIPNNTEKRFSFADLPVGVRKQNYILIKARNLSDKDFKMLVNFGRDGTKTGGVVLQVPQGADIKDYIVRIGAIYKWFSEDNNWIGIYPEGGDLEVALIRISKSD